MPGSPVPKGTQEWSDPPIMLRPKGPPALTSTTSSTLALTSFFVTLLTEVSVNDLLVTVSVVTPIWMGGAGGSLDMSSRTLSSLLEGVAAAVVGVARETERPEGPRWWKFRQNSQISHQTVWFSTKSKTCQIAVFTCSMYYAMIWQDFPPSKCLVPFGLYGVKWP